MSEESAQSDAKSVTERNPFEQPGEYEDEITITFEQKEKLYVSRVFLSHISPVFKAMFKCDFVEVIRFTLDIKDFSQDDFLEFLLCCYPGTLKRLNMNNVLRVVPIAHKYDVRPLVVESKIVMMTTLSELCKTASTKLEPKLIPKQISSIKVCLQILQTAYLLEFCEITDKAIRIISQFSSYIYLMDNKDQLDSAKDQGDDWDDIKPLGDNTECLTIFNELPSAIRIKIMKERLFLKEDGKWFR